MNDLILCILSAFIWSISTVIDKFYVLTKYKPYELFLLRSPLFFIFGLLATFYMTKNITTYKRMNKFDMLYVIGSVFFNAIALIMFWHVMLKNKSHYTLSIVQPLYICSVVLLSYLLYSEKMNFNQFMGFLIVLVGISIVNFNKDA